MGLGRIRTVKPEWRTDEKMRGASDAARVLSIALITLSDDYGNGEAGVLTIAGAVWGSGDVRESLDKSSRAMGELLAIGFAEVYRVCGQEYFHLCNWDAHQKVDRPGKPRYPGPQRADDTSEKSRERIASESRRSRERIAPDQDQDQDPDQDQDREKRARGEALELADEIWTRQENLRQELMGEGIGTNSRGLGIGDPSKLELVKRIRAALDDGKTIFSARGDCEQVLDVLASDARRDGTLRWLDGKHWEAHRYGPTLTRSPGEPFHQKRAGGSDSYATTAEILAAGEVD